MPLYWIIDSRAERALSGATVTGYRKLFEGRDGTSSMSAQELLMVTAEIRSHHSLGKVGALTIIANPDQMELFACVLGALAMADRPMKLFDSPMRARNWLDAQPRVQSKARSASACGSVF